MMLSINILTWNNIDTIERILAVLNPEVYALNESGVKTEVIIVDNGSTDGSQDYANIKNKDNLGISKGKNQGIRASKGEFIMLIDGDLVPVRNSITCLLEYMVGNKEVMALGFYPNKFTNQKDREDFKYVEQYCMRLHEVKPHVCACLFYGMYRREVFDKCMMDESYGPGYGWEDHDFFMQMKTAGIIQYVCGINNAHGKYYHAINSSIRNMGREKFITSSKERNGYYSQKWGLTPKGAAA